jgi:hypothetical protein
MLASPAPWFTVWQASAWREEGSWNHTVLVFPLEETPMGTKLGPAWTCERAVEANMAATVSATPATTLAPKASLFM